MYCNSPCIYSKTNQQLPGSLFTDYRYEYSRSNYQEFLNFVSDTISDWLNQKGLANQGLCYFLNLEFVSERNQTIG